MTCSTLLSGVCLKQSGQVLQKSITSTHACCHKRRSLPGMCPLLTAE
jgi:hypothetical protein